MGNREDLLAGARKCLLEKGYGRTTARDIAGAAGTSLAAIGYHFGSKDGLLTEVLQQALEEWGEELAALLGAQAGFEAAWDAALASFPRTGRLWAVQFELLAHLGEQPELRASLAEGNRRARLGLSELFDGPVPAGGEERAERTGAFYQALLAGLAASWLVDPDSLPSGTDLLASVKTVARTA